MRPRRPSQPVDYVTCRVPSVLPKRSRLRNSFTTTRGVESCAYRLATVNDEGVLAQTLPLEPAEFRAPLDRLKTAQGYIEEDEVCLHQGVRAYGSAGLVLVCRGSGQLQTVEPIGRHRQAAAIDTPDAHRFITEYAGRRLTG